MAGEEILIVLLIVMLNPIILMAIYSRYYKRVPPNMAMVVYGRRQMSAGMRGFTVISGGGRFVTPIVEEAQWLKIHVRQAELQLKSVVTDVAVSGAKLTMDASAAITVRRDPEGLIAAAENLLGKTDEEIIRLAVAPLEGHLRARAAMMTAVQIESDRQAFLARVRAAAEHDLHALGLEIPTFVLREVEDVDGYLSAFREANLKRRPEEIRDAVARESAQILSQETPSAGRGDGPPKK